ncbi:porin [Inmirania thermothiophila]|uniref:Putative porin n=1 Tax=Inmirania thermothiophila TaxID=1750597 RepID=A0A3N1Y898_9GAMM|nr:porin [Inmirania thermothiophila]ROR34728.1 putative porin [Inmirania thermothiophila]
MKKKLLAVAVAAAVAAPLAASAEATVYGRAKFNLINGPAKNDPTDTQVDVTPDVRIGFKGAEDLGNGLQAVFKLEYRVLDADDVGKPNNIENREQSVGLAGGFGKVLIGNLSAPYYDGSFAFVDLANIFDRDPASGKDGRIDNAVGYFGSFGAVNVGVTVGGLNGDSSDNEEDTSEPNKSRGRVFNASATADVGPVKLGLAIESPEAGDDKLAVAASYSSGAFGVALVYDDNGATDGTAIALGGQFTAGANRIYAVFVDNDKGRGKVADTNPWTLGVQHNFSKRTRVYAEVADNDKKGEDTAFGVGIRHDF